MEYACSGAIIRSLGRNLFSDFYLPDSRFVLRSPGRQQQSFIFDFFSCLEGDCSPDERGEIKARP